MVQRIMEAEHDRATARSEMRARARQRDEARKQAER
jgi:hypothetical protein